MAASGIGASDIITATLGGANHGLTLLWALVLGAFFKFVISEGLARWQLATGMTLLEGWDRYLPRWVMWVFAVYLVLWAVAVSGALVSSCGLAAETLTGGAVSRHAGALAQAVLAFFLIWSSRSGGLERVMKPLVAVMFFGVVTCAALTLHDPVRVLRGLLVPHVPDGSGSYLLSLMGGVGGTLTLLSHNYLTREASTASPGSLRASRADLAMAYLFTAVFGVSVMMVANHVFHVPRISVTDGEVVSRMALAVGEVVGRAGYYGYSVGFLAAVFASLFGVWQTIPRVLADCHGLLWRVSRENRRAAVAPGSLPFRLALVFMALSSIPFALAGRPVLIVVAFTVLGSVFIPFLAGTLLYLNNRVPFGAGMRHNHVLTNGVLVLVVVLFMIAGMYEVRSLFME